MQVNISHKQDMNMVTGSLLERNHVKELYITHDKSDGKDSIEVKINDEVIFRYDANFKGDRVTVNHIQMTVEEYENKYLPGLYIEGDNNNERKN